jgi:glucose/mannose-6-phosphate isomerase
MIENDFATELSYTPHIERMPDDAPALVLGGMGGSAAAADALAFLSAKEVAVHRDYGLPARVPSGALCIAVSYSGNTEETVSFAEAALAAGHPLAIVSSGGALESLAKSRDLPFAGVPAGRAPRNAFMYLVRALLALTGERAAAQALERVGVGDVRTPAEEDALFFEGGIPLFYASARNALLGRIGKMMMNETARMPSFTNTFPELNHNEMQSFDEDMPEAFAGAFRFMLIEDAHDHPRIARRMQVFADLMRGEGRAVKSIRLPEAREEALAAIWMRFLLAARELALANEVDPDTAPLVERFKKLL